MDETLIKEWIQYLKNNRIVSSKSDPSGKLNYLRKVTSNDIEYFLSTSTDFSNEEIKTVIQHVLSSRIADTFGSGEPATTQSQTPNAIRKREQRAASRNANSAGNKAFSQMSQTLSANKSPKLHTKLKLPTTPGAKPRVAYKGLREDIKDVPGVEISEIDVERIFKELASMKNTEPARVTQPVDNTDKQKTIDLNALKKLIKNKMTPEYRRAFFNALTDNSSSNIPNATGAQPTGNARIDPTLIENVDDQFKEFVKLHATVIRRKDKLIVEDLLYVWRLAGYPDDINKIAYILYEQGYGYKEIGNVLLKVFHNIMEDQSNEISPVIAKLAAYVKEHKLEKDVVQFMVSEFSDELFPKLQDKLQSKPGFIGRAFNAGKRLFGKKAVPEEVKKIFTLILTEDRTHVLGRNKK